MPLDGSPISCLFMGGPYDGQRQDRTTLPTYIDVPTFTKQKIAVTANDDASPPEKKEVRYVLRAITNYPVYVAPEVDENNIVHILIDGYRLPLTKH